MGKKSHKKSSSQAQAQAQAQAQTPTLTTSSAASSKQASRDPSPSPSPSTAVSPSVPVKEPTEPVAALGPESVPLNEEPSEPPVIKPSEQTAVREATATLDSLTSIETGTPKSSIDIVRPLNPTSTGLSPIGEPAGTSVITGGGGGTNSTTNGVEEVELLKKKLDKTRAEKEQLEKQYKSLVAKVGNMRDTLGKKLREDAEELDRREAQITTLSSELSTLQSDQETSQSTIQTLQSTVQTLQIELRSLNQETSALSAELSQVRQHSSSASNEALLRTRDLRELQAEMEALRLEKEEWEVAAGREKERAEDEERKGMEEEARWRRAEEEKKKEEIKAKRERERADNLQSVLEEFQAAKEAELNSAVSELEMHLRNTITSLSDWKLRASTAETQVDELNTNAMRAQTFEKEVKEKNLLIGKLRHENVIMNEHLTEALRRLRKNTSDTNVDRRLVTNILLAFLSSPRADPKKFEMLSLLSSILSWDEAERETAGLQRSTVGGAGAKRGNGGAQLRQSGKSLEKAEPANESFSQLFVEYLLKEVSSGAPPSTPSTPPSNTSALFGSGHGPTPGLYSASTSPSGEGLPTGYSSPHSASRPLDGEVRSPGGRPRIGSAGYFGLEKAWSSDRK
ncbi:GRIP-related Arf-binding domain [Phaffia rhodozyma]|uniref:GRIP-related Arf-binding domain n=1 Tax=Phaffia rhodozyma TaxID=264483 RepID=A0A0F7SH23_PHARH|nr:GRIP-related Arf-binding domain [Phaffia rhodozyma]